MTPHVGASNRAAAKALNVSEATSCPNGMAESRRPVMIAAASRVGDAITMTTRTTTPVVPLGFKNRIAVLFNWTLACLSDGRPQRAITKQQVFAREEALQAYNNRRR